MSLSKTLVNPRQEKNKKVTRVYKATSTGPTEYDSSLTKSPTILAIDVGSNLGYVYGVSSISWKKGLLKVSKHKYPKGWSILSEWLKNILSFTRIKEIAIEKPHVTKKFFHPIKILFGMLSIIESVADSFNVKIFYYSPGEIKKFWTGNGRASKQDMLNVTQKEWPGIKDHNVSDALALFIYHLKKRQPYERKNF